MPYKHLLRTPRATAGYFPRGIEMQKKVLIMECKCMYERTQITGFSNRPRDGGIGRGEGGTYMSFMENGHSSPKRTFHPSAPKLFRDCSFLHGGGDAVGEELIKNMAKLI